MKKLLMGGAVAALTIAVAPALAQVAPPPGVASGTTATPAPRAAPRVQMRMMSDKTMTRDEVVSHVRDMFARFDSNRDGYVTREELGSFHYKMIGMHGDMEKRLADRGVFMDRGAAFDRLDTNHDGSISRQEFTAAHEQVREKRVIVMRDGAGPDGAGKPGMKMRMHGMGGLGGRLFEKADTNRDGRVSLAEAQATALAHFDKADANHDGRITPDERQHVRMMRLERRAS